MVDKNEKSVATRDINRAIETAKGTIIPPVDIYEDTDGVTLLQICPESTKKALMCR